MEWISSKDRLPETTDEMLVWDGDSVMTAQYWKVSENEIADGWHDSYSGEEIERVSHWMTLPAPPSNALLSKGNTT